VSLAVSGRERFFVFTIALAGLSVRPIALSWITLVDFKWESYHSRQIAYYTLKIAFNPDRLPDTRETQRLWALLLVAGQSIFFFNDIGVYETDEVPLLNNLAAG